MTPPALDTKPTMPQINQMAHPGGRPTKYRPKYCQMVIENGKAGYSLTSAAAKLDVSRDTLTEWGSVHPEFSAAMKRAKALAGNRWEQRASELTDKGGSGGQVAMTIFALKNLAPDDWKDKHETVHSGTLTLAALVEQAHAQIADSAKTIEGETQDVDATIKNRGTTGSPADKGQ
jgi:hypothetical protein